MNAAQSQIPGIESAGAFSFDAIREILASEAEKIAVQKIGRGNLQKLSGAQIQAVCDAITNQKQSLTDQAHTLKSVEIISDESRRVLDFMRSEYRLLESAEMIISGLL